MLRVLGHGYRLLCMLKCKVRPRTTRRVEWWSRGGEGSEGGGGGEQEAVDVFRELPPEHYRTGWVQCQVGAGAGIELLPSQGRGGGL